ncbi:unnamed protein product [Rhizophagus irregularis]|nr:unnamed protein product [Rhizophagus irregularis]
MVYSQPNTQANQQGTSSEWNQIKFKSNLILASDEWRNQQNDIQIFVLIKYEGDGVYYPTAVNFKSQYDVDEFLGIHHLQSVDLEGRPTGTHRTRKYKDLIPESYYIVA